MYARIQSGMLAHCHLSHLTSQMLPPPLCSLTLSSSLPIGSRIWLVARGRPGGLPDIPFFFYSCWATCPHPSPDTHTWRRQEQHTPESPRRRWRFGGTLSQSICGVTHTTSSGGGRKNLSLRPRCCWKTALFSWTRFTCPSHIIAVWPNVGMAEESRGTGCAISAGRRSHQTTSAAKDTGPGRPSSAPLIASFRTRRSTSRGSLFERRASRPIRCTRLNDLEDMNESQRLDGEAIYPMEL